MWKAWHLILLKSLLMLLWARNSLYRGSRYECNIHNDGVKVLLQHKFHKGPGMSGAFSKIGSGIWRVRDMTGQWHDLSVIWLVSDMTGQSCHCKLWFKRLNHISLFRVILTQSYYTSSYNKNHYWKITIESISYFM